MLKPRLLLLCFLLPLGLACSTQPLAAQYVFQQNDNSQTVTNADGSQFTYPDNNFWTQPYTTAESVMGNTYPNALTNWTALTSYPDGPGVTATINAGSCHLNENASFQSVTVGSAGSLAIDSGNSGGAGNHSIAVTMAAGGAGTVQNAGSITIGAAEQNTTITLANNLTLSGSGSYNFTNPTNLIQGPGTLILSPEVTLVGTAGADISAPFANAGLIESTESGGLTLNPATATNTGTLAAVGGGVLTLTNIALDNTNGMITVGDANSVVIIENGIVVTGGTLQCTVPAVIGNDYGVFRLQDGATLANLTIATNAGVKVENTGALAGTVTNDGFLLVPGNFTLNLAGSATLAGSGTLHLGGHLEGANGATLTIGQGQILQLEGAGNTSGIPDTIDASVINNGTLAGVYLQGLINSPVFTNNGLLAANNNANVSVSGTTNFSNFDSGSQTLTGGTYAVTDQGNGATLDLGGRNVLVNAAAITLSGANANFSALDGMTTNAGTLAVLAQKQFSTSAALSNTGAISVDAGSTVAVGGAFTGAAGSTLTFTVGGTQSQGAQSPGVLQVGGAATLGGNLVVTIAPGTQLAPTDLVAIASAASFAGSFANVVNGERVATSDGSGTLQVNYGSSSAFSPGTLILSNFEPTGTANIIPSFFTGEANLGGGAYYLAFRNGNIFGYYSFLTNPAYIYHYDLGYEYVFDAADGNDGVYLYDFASSDFFYTSPTFPFPYLYDFSLNTVLYYYPDPNNPGHYNTNGIRYFYNFATGQIITR